MKEFLASDPEDSDDLPSDIAGLFKQSQPKTPKNKPSTPKTRITPTLVSTVPAKRPKINDYRKEMYFFYV